MQKTVQDIINIVLAEIPGAPYSETVDVLKTGDSKQKVSGVVLTFMATYPVIEQAIQSGANLIITHEPTFYNHLDEVNWLKNDVVYQAKLKLINENKIAIWRFHDYLHSLRPDPTIAGLIKTLAWTQYALPEHPYVCKLPSRTLKELIVEIKSKLGLETVRVVGDMNMPCASIGVIVGAPGGGMQIQAMSDLNLDVLVCGEINEWEINEYVRDANAIGHAKALIVTGHSSSEEDGMREMVSWLQARLPEMPITFIPIGNVLRTE